MLVPVHLRKDRTVPVITVGLDGTDTELLKKFKCSVCGNTVFGYYDSLRFVIPADIHATGERDSEFFVTVDKPLVEVECTHRYRTDLGKMVRCRTVYLIVR